MTRTRTALRRTLAAFAISGLALAGVVVTAAPAHAALITVSNTTDADPGSLRAAVIQANSTPGADTIQFQTGLGTIVVTSGTIEITESLTITGPGAANLSISREGNFDLFTIDVPDAATDPVDVTIEELDFIGNFPLFEGSGLVALNETNDVRNLRLTNTVWGGFHTDDEGGAVAVYAASGDISIAGSTFVENAADGAGGAIYLDNVGGTVSLTNSDFFDNASDSQGGAVWTGNVDSIQVTGSEFDENEAQASAGAIYIEEITGTSLIELTTFTDNSAGVSSSSFTYGGAVYVEYVALGETLRIRQSSFLDSALVAGSSEAYGASLFIDVIDGDVLIDSSTFARGEFQDSGGNPTFGAGLSIALCLIESDGNLTVINSTFDDDVTLDSYSIHSCEIQAGGALTVLYSTMVGPGNVTVETNDGEVFISSTILDASTFDAVFIDNSTNPAEVEWSLLSTALDAAYVTNGAGNTFNVADPLLGPLQNNGGPTQTRLLLPGSPALEKGNPAVSGQPAFDQRGSGFPRVNGRIDIGAIEMPRTLPATGTVNDGALGLAAILLLIAGFGLVMQGRRALLQRGSR